MTEYHFHLWVAISGILICNFGCRRGDLPLDGNWVIQRTATEAQRNARLGEWTQSQESPEQWAALLGARFIIRNHSELLVEEKTRRQKLRLTAKASKDDLWMLTVWYKDRMFKLKAARIGDELRLLDNRQLFVLKE